MHNAHRGREPLKARVRGIDPRVAELAELLLDGGELPRQLVPQHQSYFDGLVGHGSVLDRGLGLLRGTDALREPLGPHLVAADVAYRLLKEDARIDLVELGEFVTAEHDLVGRDHAPGGVKKRNSFQAIAFQSFAPSWRTLEGGICA